MVHVRDLFVNFRFVEQVGIRQLFFNDFFQVLYKFCLELILLNNVYKCFIFNIGQLTASVAQWIRALSHKRKGRCSNPSHHRPKSLKKQVHC